MLTLRVLLAAIEVGMFGLVYYAMTRDVGISSAFTWHPILMTFGFAVCMNEGMIMYYYGDIQHISRHDSRKKHGVLQVLALLSIIGGYVAIFVAHQGKSQFGAGAPTIKQVHVWLGYILIILTLFQAIVGLNKYVKKSTSGKSIAKWHGYLGLVIYLLGQTNIFIAALFWGTASWSKPMALGCTLASVAALMYLRFHSMKVKGEKSDRLLGSKGKTGESTYQGV